MRGPILRAAALLCCAAAIQAHAAPYQLTSHVSGVGEFSLYHFGIDVQSDGWAAYDVTYRATIDYNGSGPYDSTVDIPVEVTIAVAGKPVQTSTITGAFSIERTSYIHGPNVGKSYLLQRLSVYAPSSSWKLGMTFEQTMEFDGTLASGPDNLPFALSAGPSSGSLNYYVYAATDVGDMGAGSAYGTITNMSFTLAPVPEPTGWAMLGAGLLLTGAVARRRQRGQARQATAPLG